MEGEIREYRAPNGSFEKKIEVPGTGIVCPAEQSQCRISFRVISESPLIKDLTVEIGENVEFVIGRGFAPVDSIVEKILRTMKRGELCKVTISGDLPLILEIKLLGFSVVPDINQVGDPQILKWASEYKMEGVRLFNDRKIDWAFVAFSKSIKCCVLIDKSESLRSDEERRLLESLRVTGRLNVAACQMAKGKYEYAAKNCDCVLEEDPNNIKALYRRGVALTNLQEYDRAKMDLVRVREIDPNNGAAEKQLRVLKEKVKQLNDKYGNAMKKMFN